MKPWMYKPWSPLLPMIWIDPIDGLKLKYPTLEWYSDSNEVREIERPTVQVQWQAKGIRIGDYRPLITVDCDEPEKFCEITYDPERVTIHPMILEVLK